MGVYGPGRRAAALPAPCSARTRPLAAATLVGCAIFFGGTLLNQALIPVEAPVPPVEVRRLDGSTVSLDKFVGRPLIVNLWATWCPPCRREMPALKSAQQAHPEVEFVFVNQGESVEAVKNYLATHRLQMPNVVTDPAKQLSARTGSSGYPTTLFYDTKGRLYLRHMGELSRAILEEKIIACSKFSKPSRTLAYASVLNLTKKKKSGYLKNKNIDLFYAHSVQG